MAIKERSSETVKYTEFLNVDLEIVSRFRLDALVEAFGAQVDVMRHVREPRRNILLLELELCSHPRDVCERVCAFVKRVTALPPHAKRVWDRAQTHTFDIGIQAGLGPYPFEMILDPNAVQAIANAGGQVQVSVYGAKARTSR